MATVIAYLTVVNLLKIDPGVRYPPYTEHTRERGLISRLPS